MLEGLFQPMHLLVIFGIALLVFGPKKLPELGKGIGEGIRGFKSAMKAEEETPVSTTIMVANDQRVTKEGSWVLAQKSCSCLCSGSWYWVQSGCTQCWPTLRGLKLSSKTRAVALNLSSRQNSMLHLRMAKPIARMNQLGTREPFSGPRHRTVHAALTTDTRKGALC